MVFVSTKCHLEEHVPCPLSLPSTTLSREVTFSAFYTADPSNLPSYLQVTKYIPLFFLLSSDQGASSFPKKLDVHLLDKFRTFLISLYLFPNMRGPLLRKHLSHQTFVLQQFSPVHLLLCQLIVIYSKLLA